MIFLPKKIMCHIADNNKAHLDFVLEWQDIFVSIAYILFNVLAKCLLKQPDGLQCIR